MKNYTKIFIAIVAVVFLASAQITVKAQAFENGSLVGNAGLGFGWYGYDGNGLSNTPFMNLSLEKGIKDFDFGVLSVGGIVGFKYSSGDYNWSGSDFVIAANGAIHADIFKVENLDTYGGLAIGLRFSSWEYDDPFSSREYSDSEVNGVFAPYVGARYYFTSQFAVFGEAGWRPSALNLGVSYKFK